MLKVCSLYLMLLLSFPVFATQPYQVVDWIEDNVFTQGIEGPAVDANGRLFAVNFFQQGTIGLGTIGVVKNKGNAQLFATLPKGSVGNGIRFDNFGNMYVADYTNHNVLRLKPGSKTWQVFAHQPRMNQPNDLAIMNNGILFASDPNWANSTGQLWRIDSIGKTTLLEANMGTTNGIEVSPNQRHLYVNESVQRKVWVYDLSPKGEVSNKRLLIAFDDHGLDGMRTDNQSNLYIARYGKGEVAVVSPKGKLLRQIKLKGQYPTNVAFNGNRVYVTMQKRGAIESFVISEG